MFMDCPLCVQLLISIISFTSQNSSVRELLLYFTKKEIKAKVVKLGKCPTTKLLNNSNIDIQRLSDSKALLFL